jgi:hypothetical protein
VSLTFSQQVSVYTIGFMYVALGKGGFIKLIGGKADT